MHEQFGAEYTSAARHTTTPSVREPQETFQRYRGIRVHALLVSSFGVPRLIINPVPAIIEIETRVGRGCRVRLTAG